MRIARPILLLASLLCGTAAASPQNLPYDFSYAMFGSSVIRPLLAFNDGFNTYIQPANPDAIENVVDREATRQGPYLVIEGVPSEIVLVGRNDERLTIRYQQHLAPAYVHATHQGGGWDASSTAAGLPTCDESALETSVIAVNFAGGGDTLSAEGAQKVMQSVGRPNVMRVLITSPRNAGQGATVRRNDYLAGLLGRIGIPRGRISFMEGDTFEGATEIEVRSKGGASQCEPGRPYAVSDGQNLVVTAIEADLNAAVGQIANALQKQFVIEGNLQPTIINLQIASMPIIQALMLIGDKVSPVADLILRDKELVLRYKSTGTWGRL